MNLDKFTGLVGRLSEEFEESGVPASSYFLWAIKKQNEIYELPINTEPTLDPALLNETASSRIKGFLKTLKKEMDEGKEVEAMIQIYETITEDDSFYQSTEDLTKAFKVHGIHEHDHALKLAQTFIKFSEEVAYPGLTARQSFAEFVLVSLADWFADMNVYIRSEALKFGMPHESNLAIVMGSNFTKLGEDGNPIKDENGKFLKGPNFIPPEEAIHASMFKGPELEAELEELTKKADRVGSVLALIEDPMDEVFGTFDEDYIDSEYDISDEDGEE